ncbi:MAG: UDP-N-acetylmuramate:L-alanyl-gamma-D-glutamyl-meso-diaminopimelate ligase [Gammaproteobacteria bacterium]|nr:UDP-N-acetylmuramate:L-alanyl-gamma-D-glutamyl-meso-diaminopimelate ligase [Gammaproteobacteria bacterium]
MHLHILGVAGSFMAGIARIASECGHRVTGSDAALYPPMSTQLEQAGVECRVGYEWSHLEPPPDCVVVGNVMSRGHAIVEQLLNSSIPYVSGPQWLRDHLLRERWVLAVAGTHGKTTTSAMLAHILIEAGGSPGYLIGGVAARTQKSAQAGQPPHFVIEADEYDTAFFDKRSKFVHYCPRTLVLTNLEYDHADIFDDLEAIQRQFHHLLRTVPSEGRILCRAGDPNLQKVLDMGCWTPVETFGFEEDSDWCCQWQAGQELMIQYDGAAYVAQGHQPLGMHNALNATAAVAAAAHAGIPVQTAADALASFEGVLRRLTQRPTRNGGVYLYDDFAHHPTEIRASIEAVRERHPDQPILAVVEPASNSMRLGVHRDSLAEALKEADRNWLHVSQEMQWDAAEWGQAHGQVSVTTDLATLEAQIREQLASGGVVLVMSNRAGSDICQHLESRL